MLLLKSIKLKQPTKLVRYSDIFMKAKRKRELIQQKKRIITWRWGLARLTLCLRRFWSFSPPKHPRKQPIFGERKIKKGLERCFRFLDSGRVRRSDDQREKLHLLPQRKRERGELKRGKKSGWERSILDGVGFNRFFSSKRKWPLEFDVAVTACITFFYFIQSYLIINYIIPSKLFN